MAPTRTVKSKSFSKNGKSSKGPGKSGGALGAKTKSRVSKKPKAPASKQQKTKSAAPAMKKKKKKRVYSEKDLGIPKLNMITPVGVELPKGKKTGKVFVDDTVVYSTLRCLNPSIADSFRSPGEHDDDTRDR